MASKTKHFRHKRSLQNPSTISLGDAVSEPAVANTFVPFVGSGEASEPLPTPIDTAEPIETVEPIDTAEPINTVEPIDMAEPIDTAEMTVQVLNQEVDRLHYCLKKSQKSLRNLMAREEGRQHELQQVKKDYEKQKKQSLFFAILVIVLSFIVLLRTPNGLHSLTIILRLLGVALFFGFLYYFLHRRQQQQPQQPQQHHSFVPIYSTTLYNMENNYTGKKVRFQEETPKATPLRLQDLPGYPIPLATTEQPTEQVKTSKNKEKGVEEMSMAFP